MLPENCYLYSKQYCGALRPSKAQLRLISSMIRMHEFSALYGVCVAVDT